jgi:hypothetical protein
MLLLEAYVHFRVLTSKNDKAQKYYKAFYLQRRKILLTETFVILKHNE